MSATRDQIINFLLQNDDDKNRIIADLQKQIAQLSKDIDDKNNAKPAVESAPPLVNGKSKTA